MGNAAPTSLGRGKDYYKTLGIANDASDRDIKTAYRKMALSYHPGSTFFRCDSLIKFDRKFVQFTHFADKNADPGAEEKFKASEARII